MFSCLLQLYDKSKKTNKITSAAEVKYLEKNLPNRVHLITYSQLDIRKFPTRQSFYATCALTFGGSKVLYCAVQHTSSGAHYHVSIHLKSPQKWLSANFAKSPSGGTDAGAYRYLCKSDSFVYHGSFLEQRPDLSMIGQNKSAANANAVYRAKRAAIVADTDNNNSPFVPKNPKHEKINKLDVAEFIVVHNIKKDLELMNSIV